MVLGGGYKIMAAVSQPANLLCHYLLFTIDKDFGNLEDRVVLIKLENIK